MFILSYLLSQQTRLITTRVSNSLVSLCKHFNRTILTQHFSMNNPSTAGIIVIGDEILSGETQDTNSYFLAKELLQCGVKVVRISVVPDCIDAIAEEVSRFSNKYTYVLTTGGVGPTHDDMTYAGVAKAFNKNLVLDKTLYESLLSKFSKYSMDKLCSIPESAIIHRSSFHVPIISINNVFMFPGIPSYLRCTFDYLKNQFTGHYKIYKKYLYTSISEFAFSEELSDTAEEFAGRVEFGSYPKPENPEYSVKLILKSEAEDDLLAAEAYIRNTFPDDPFVEVSSPNSSMSFEELLESTEHNDLVKVIQDSITTIQECFNKYSFDNVCLSFNGGKDCTVLLYLIHQFLKTKKKLKAFYVSDEETFPEIYDFVMQSAKEYNLNVLNYRRPMQGALTKLKAEHPEIKCFIMGVRCTDPGADNLGAFQHTDEAWPEFMRCSPIVRWNYHQIWQFLRLLQIPYCSLYDKGYTSLGCRSNTVQNPKLKVRTNKGKEFYYPAYLLKDPNQERDGRQHK